MAQRQELKQAVPHLEMSPWRCRRFSLALFFCRSLCLLVLGSLAVGVLVASEVQRASATAKSAGLSTAIADFDGDLRPDLASVQGGSGDAYRATYWIQFQLTSVGRQSIRVVAPSGGLQIAARDVNGDHAIDLVVTTAVLGEPVAVFLNDGHGGFSQADQAAFPGAFGNSETNFASTPHSQAQVAALPSSFRTGMSSESKPLPRMNLDLSGIAISILGSPFDRPPCRHPGRAPPFGIPQL